MILPIEIEWVRHFKNLTKMKNHWIQVWMISNINHVRISIISESVRIAIKNFIKLWMQKLTLTILHFLITKPNIKWAVLYFQFMIKINSQPNLWTPNEKVLPVDFIEQQFQLHHLEKEGAMLIYHPVGNNKQIS